MPGVQGQWKSNEQESENQMNDNTDIAVIDENEPQAELPVARVTPTTSALTPQQARTVEVSDALAPAYAKASTLELTDAEVALLMAPFPDSAVDIRPHDGLIFISHIHISDRLNAVFKPGKWALLCRRHWLEGGTLYGEYVLLIRGCFVGESVGGHQYQPNNPKTNYSDSLESTAAEALRRIAGKRLSCGSQVWRKDYAEKWVAANAEQVGGKWRKRSTAQQKPNESARGTPKQAVSPRTPAPTPRALTPAERKEKLLAALKGIEAEATKVFIEEGLIFEGETFHDISTTRIDLFTPDQMLALIKTVKQRRADNDQVPGAEVQDDPGLVDDGWLVGVVEAVNQKDGTSKAGKAFTKYGVKVSGDWLNTFSKTIHDQAEALKGQEVRYTISEGKFGKDITAIEPHADANAEVVP